MPVRDGTKDSGDNFVDIQSSVEGERKQVTVLFADLVDSTRIIEAMDVEESAAITEPCLDAMMTCVRRYQGTVTRAMGDGIVALFGAPVAQEDHATRACYAALDIQRSMEELSEFNRHRLGEPLRARVGLNSGEVVVKAIGDDFHMDYDAIGMPVHMAARMEKAASAGAIQLTAQTLALTKNSIDVEPLDPIAVKGVSEPVQVYGLIGVNPGGSRFSAAGGRALSTLVGRGSYLATLKKAFDRIAKGSGQIIAVVGDPGIGKSRLILEFVHSLPTENTLVLECGAVSYRTSTPWALFVDLLRSYFVIQDGDNVQRVIDKVTARVGSLDDSLKPSVSALCSLLGVDTGDAMWKGLEPLQRRWRVQQAVKALLLRESVERPVVVIFEDLHWADEASLQLIEALLENLASKRLLLLVTYRPEFKHSWANHSAYTQIRVEPLGHHESNDLLASLLGNDPTLVRVNRIITDQAQGNALFLEEIVQSLVESGRLEGESGAYRLRGDTESLDLPKTVQALIAARIDRLEPVDKKLLSTASVIGHEIPYPLLLAVSGQTEPVLESSLSRLKSGEYVYEKQLFPETVYAFKHALIHDVTLRSLLKGQQRRLHAQVGDAMERIYPTRQVELAESIARHFAEGANWPKAMRNYLLAAENSKAQYALDHAIDLCHRGLACVEQAAGDMEFERQLHVLLGDLWSQYDDVQKANEAYERAILVAGNSGARRGIENKIHRLAYVTRENGRVAFYTHGPKGRTIVFSSPISYGNGTWQLLIDRLCQEFQIVTIDSRGVGASDPLAPDWTLKEDLEDVRAVIEALDDEPVTVVGLSHTGAMAVRLAAMYPHLVERVVVIGGTFGKAEPGGDMSGFLGWASETRAIIDRGDYEGAVRKVLYEAMPQPEMRDLREAVVKDLAIHVPIDVFCATILDVESEIACEPYAKDVRAPTLVVHGTEDLSVPFAHGVYLASIIPGAIFYPFQGHGHEPQMTATAEFCDVLRQFARTGSVNGQKAAMRNVI